MAIKHVIFDLDGTLVDSAPGILNSFRNALEGLGLQSDTPLTRHLIGPPLKDIVECLLPNAEVATRMCVIEDFKRHYDTLGVLDSVCFEGVENCLAQLRAAGLKLWLATNKRLAPTRSLMRQFKWEALFEKAYSLDSFNPPKSTKAEILQDLLQKHSIDCRDAVYIGDRKEDEEAARVCGLQFLMAGWGYDLSCREAVGLVSEPIALPKLIQQFD
jgi:phosphoglycolate phosphatase